MTPICSTNQLVEPHPQSEGITVDLQMTCTCGHYVISPAAVFVEMVRLHVVAVHPDRVLSDEQIRERATWA